MLVSHPGLLAREVMPVPGLVVRGVAPVLGLAVRDRRVRLGTGLGATAPFCGGHQGDLRRAEVGHGWPSRRHTM
jgi:hypothetical protein